MTIAVDWDLKNQTNQSTKMATMSIYSEKSLKSSLEPEGRLPWDLVCSIVICGCGPNQVCSHDDPMLG